MDILFESQYESLIKEKIVKEINIIQLSKEKSKQFNFNIGLYMRVYIFNKRRPMYFHGVWGFVSRENKYIAAFNHQIDEFSVQLNFTRT